MKRSILLIALVLLLGACGRLGLDEQTCEPHVRKPTAANVLAAQAVPSARYTPCFKSIDPGWDQTEFEAEAGRAGIAIVEGTDSVVAAIVTKSCDVGDAVRVESGMSDVARYEAIEHVPLAISVAVVPTGLAELAYARELVNLWDGVELDERPVTFVVDSDVEMPVAARVAAAQANHEFAMLVDGLDVAERTVELRSSGRESYAQLTMSDALDLIERLSPTPIYRGNWYFTFDGGCITYVFDVEELLAESAPRIATDSIGFYPAHELADYRG